MGTMSTQRSRERSCIFYLVCCTVILMSIPTIQGTDDRIPSLSTAMDDSVTTTMNVNMVSSPQLLHAELNALKKELQVMKIQRDKYRRQLGELSCECKNIGPTGGFCLSKDEVAIGGNHFLAPFMGSALYEFFTDKTVIDLGAGLGQYENLFRNLKIAYNNQGGPRSIVSYDGAENIESVTNGRVKWADLTEIQSLGLYDWVLSIEVAEHIPVIFEDIFLQNLHRHNKEGIVMSWAVKNQGGHFHVNEQNEDYVLPRITALGYSFDSELSQQLRIQGNKTLPWLLNTVYVFRRNK